MLITNFSNFYANTFPKRGLSFSFVNSICELEAKLPSKTYLFILNTIQALILLTFNEIGTNKEITISRLISKLNISEEDIRISIVPLVFIL